MSTTLGTSEALDLHKTLRLRAFGQHEQVMDDITEERVAWESSAPHLVRVTQSGLVQRLRSTAQTVTITAREIFSGLEAQTEINGDL